MPRESNSWREFVPGGVGKVCMGRVSACRDSELRNHHQDCDPALPLGTGEFALTWGCSMKYLPPMVAESPA